VAATAAIIAICYATDSVTMITALLAYYTLSGNGLPIILLTVYIVPYIYHSIRVYKIGDHNLDQNIVDSKATTVLLKLRSIAKVEYKLISGPPLDWLDQLLEP
jgi:hypothetical protein